MICPERVRAYGPSPRVRGIPSESVPASNDRRSIPAGAGNPRPAESPRRGSRVHPRGCGESCRPRPPRRPGPGPSPRVRGILLAVGAPPRHRGSIPAGAGNPPSAIRSPNRGTVHPRGCGESRLAAARHGEEHGPSPRVRGILLRRSQEGRTDGSIPAGAGNPEGCVHGLRACGVHPRGCGESFDQIGARVVPQGPSPRVRGIHEGPQPGGVQQGSIPAGAGNPTP